jgi:prepilin peptidase CpaA
VVVLITIGAVGALWAVVSDVRFSRISNRNVGAVASLGLIARLVDCGWASVVWGGLGGCLAAVAVVMPYRAAWIGGGDAKLAIALALLIGPVAAVYMLAFALALASLQALVTKSRSATTERGAVAVRLAPAICVGAAIGAAVGATL